MKPGTQKATLVPLGGNLFRLHPSSNRSGATLRHFLRALVKLGAATVALDAVVLNASPRGPFLGELCSVLSANAVRKRAIIIYYAWEPAFCLVSLHFDSGVNKLFRCWESSTALIPSNSFTPILESV